MSNDPSTIAFETIVAVPHIVSQRAWECAVDLGHEHSSALGSAPLGKWLQTVAVSGDPALLNWADCGALFRAHRYYRGVRA